MELMQYEERLISDMMNISDKKNRYEQLQRLMLIADAWRLNGYSRVDAFVRRLEDVIKNERSLFPSVEDIFDFAIRHNSLELVVFLSENTKMNIHEYRFECGRSALHYLIEHEIFGSSDRHHSRDIGNDFSEYNYFIDNTEENHCDSHGFSYFHGACVLGNVEAVRRFIGGADRANVLDLDTYYASSPLHLACKYSQLEVARVLLENGADPRRLDRGDKSSPLHALARLRICDCKWRCSEAPRPVDPIVEALVARGADIEARDLRGFTCLERATSLVDLELARSLFKHGASAWNLDPKKMFSEKFERTELRRYAAILRLAEIIQLLSANYYVTDFQARFGILKHWTSVRGNDIDYLMPEESKESYHDQVVGYHNLVTYLNVWEKHGLFKKREVVDRFRERHPFLHPRSLDDWCRRNIMRYYSNPDIMNEWKRRCITVDQLETEVTKMKNIMLTESVSLHRFCQMSHREGYSILKKIKDFRVPPLRDLRLTRLMVYRHVANGMMRLHFELFAADLFMQDHCKLYLPYTACREIAKHMSDEDLFRLCERTSECDIK